MSRESDMTTATGSTRGRRIGSGHTIQGRCDQCHGDGQGRRHKAKVQRGSLRGVMGLICPACLAENKKAVP